MYLGKSHFKWQKNPDNCGINFPFVLFPFAILVAVFTNQK